MGGPAGALPSFLHGDDRLPLVGRDGQVETLARAAKAAAVEDRRVVVVSGPAGAGKSRLAAEFGTALHDEGWHVIGGRCRSGLNGGLEPIAAAVRQLLGTAGDEQLRTLPRADAAALARLVPTAARRLHVAAIDESESPPHVIRRAAEGALVTLSEMRPVALFIDDLHWADPDTLELVRHLSTNDEVRPGLLLVLALRREQPTDDLARFVADLRRQPRVEWVEAHPLEAGDVAELLEVVAGGGRTSASAAAVDRIVRFTGGNPFFIGEVLALLAEREGLEALDDPSFVLPLPTSVVDVVRDRLLGVGTDDLSVLQAAAVLDTPADVTLLGSVADVTVATAGDAVDAAVAANLLQVVEGGQFRFPHDLLRAAIDTDLRPAQRCLLHQRAAAALAAPCEAGLVPSSRRAKHLLAAAPLGGGPEVVDALEEAAASALQTYAAGTAASLYGRAVELAATSGLPPSRQLRLQVSWCKARYRAGDLAAGDEFLELGRRALAADEVEVAADAAVLCHRSFDFESSVLVDLQERALARLPPSDRRRRAQLLACLAGDLRLGPAEARRAVDRALAAWPEDGTDRDRLSFLLNLTLGVDGPASADLLREIAEERLQLSRRIPDLLQETQALRDVAAASLTLGRFDEARRAMAMMVEAATRLGEAIPSYAAFGLQFGDALYRGQFDEAADWAARTAACFSEDDPALQAASGLITGWLRGMEEPVVDALGVGAAAIPNEAAFAVVYALALVLTRRIEEGAAVLRSTVKVDDGELTYASSQTNALVPFLVGEMAPILGSRELAEAAFRRLAPLRGRAVVVVSGLAQLGPVDRVLGGLEAFLGRSAEAAASLRDALAFVRRTGGRPWAARIALDLSELPCVEPEEARALRTEARALAEELSLRPLLERLAAAPADDTSPPPPTASAKREAALVRGGKVWTVCFDGSEAHVADSKGIALLASLLSRSGQEVHCLDLVEGRAPGSSVLLEVSDRTAREAYRRRLEDLDEALDRADRSGDRQRADAAAAEREALVAHLGAAFDRHGRPRPSYADVERARVSASRLVRSAIDRIADVHPTLGEHLRRTIRTGTHCSYLPDPRHAPAWRLQP
jgi:predicted ATPase